jgi:long-chain acyl-CoA synthetase
MYPGRHAIDHPDRIAFIMAGTGERITYARFDARANRLAHFYRAAGLRRLDHVAYFMENNPWLLTAMSAGERSGLYYTPVNSFLSAEEAAYIIDNCDARVVVTSAAKLDVARRLPELCPHVEHWLIADDDDPPAPFVPIERVVQDQPDTPLPDERLGTPMFYSSGTTGKPKAIQRGIQDVPPSEMLAIEEYGRQVFHLREGMTFLSPAPLYHSGPQSSVAIGVRLGATSIIMDRFDAKRYLELVDAHRVTHSMVVPTMFSRMLRLPEQERTAFDLSSLEAVVHGAAPCPVPVKEEMLRWWGPVIYEYYGATEANGITGCGPEEWLAHKGTVGRPILGEPVILDEHGDPCPPGVPGTIWFRGGNSQFEYYHDAGKTAEARDASGTMSKVGDIGYLDEGGYLYLTDRQSFVIISGGVNIYPQEVENLLLSHPAVLDAAVFGVPDEDMGEQVKAVVELADPTQAGPGMAAELIDFCRDRLARFKCPRSVDFTTTMPRLPTGKLYKQKLREQYWPAPTR